MRRSLFNALHGLSDHRKQIADRVDRRVATFMNRTGHVVERWILAIIFIWFGTLKLIGEFSASSIIAKSVFLFDPAIMVPILGFWELIIGLFLILPGAQRLAILLLVLRLPGTMLALVLKYQMCFDSSIFLPTIQGQYLLKELTLLGAALVIGGSVRAERPDWDV